jgi:hypothetical protein
MRISRFLLLIALPALLGMAMAGCATSGGHGSEAPLAEISARAEKGGFPDGDIPAASHLYALKCARCHKFYDPAQYSDEEWQLWMRKMSRKSKLQPSEDQLLSRYLGAARNAR